MKNWQLSGTEAIARYWDGYERGCNLPFYGHLFYAYVEHVDDGEVLDWMIELHCRW